MGILTVTSGITNLIAIWEPKLAKLPPNTITQKWNRQSRTIKQIVGHMIDSASNNHQRMIRLQYNSMLTFPDYRQDNDLWISLQNYQNEDWNNLVQLWKYYNLHMIQVIKSIDWSALNNYWYDYEMTKVTLQEMVEGYLSHLVLHLNEIQELIDQKTPIVHD